jgi:hypothetical protein
VRDLDQLRRRVHRARDGWERGYELVFVGGRDGEALGRGTGFAVTTIFPRIAAYLQRGQCLSAARLAKS